MSLLLALQPINALITLVGVFAAGEAGSVTVRVVEPPVVSDILNQGTSKNRVWNASVVLHTSHAMSEIRSCYVTVEDQPWPTPYESTEVPELSWGVRLAQVRGKTSTGKLTVSWSSVTKITRTEALGCAGRMRIRKIDNPTEDEILAVVRYFWGLND